MEREERIERAPGAFIVGTLRVRPETPRRVVVLVHGVLAHRDAMFLPVLAARLPFSTFRFDLRGHGASSGALTYAGYDHDVEDLVTVVSHLRASGFEVVGLIGHSRGGGSVMRYTALHGNLLFAINLSGRFDMSRVLAKHTAEERAQLEQQGWFPWKYTVRGVSAEIRVTRAEIEKFRSFDMSIVGRIPPSIAVLTVHGLRDTVVPVDDAASFANLIPNHTLHLMHDADHYYKGKHGELVTVIVSWLDASQRRARLDRAFAMLTRPRHVPLVGARNFRDLGGYPTADGFVTRAGVVFRAAELSELTEADHVTLRSLGIDRVLDLRSNVERRVRAPPAIDGIEYVDCAIFPETDYSPEALTRRFSLYARGVEGFVEAYMYMMQSGALSFARALNLIANAPAPLAFHCTAGKDRTGVLAMLLLTVLGVDREIIAWDYEQTQRIAERTTGTLLRIASMGGEVTEEQAQNLMSARAESMLRTIEAVEGRWGSVHGYLRTVAGVTDETLAALRSRLLVKPAVGPTISAL